MIVNRVLSKLKRVEQGPKLLDIMSSILYIVLWLLYSYTNLIFPVLGHAWHSMWSEPQWPAPVTTSPQ